MAGQPPKITDQKAEEMRLKEERLAKALRDNLKKRKTRQRQMKKDKKKHH